MKDEEEGRTKYGRSFENQTSEKVVKLDKQDLEREVCAVRGGEEEKRQRDGWLGCMCKDRIRIGTQVLIFSS